MSTAPIELPGDPEALREFALRQQHELHKKSELLDEKASLVDALSDELRILREHIRLLNHHRFGRKSEQSSDEQIRLFNEAEAAPEPAEA